MKLPARFHRDDQLQRPSGGMVADLAATGGSSSRGRSAFYWLTSCALHLLLLAAIGWWNRHPAELTLAPPIRVTLMTSGAPAALLEAASVAPQPRPRERPLPAPTAMAQASREVPPAVPVAPSAPLSPATVPERPPPPVALAPAAPPLDLPPELKPAADPPLAVPPPRARLSAHPRPEPAPAMPSPPVSAQVPPARLPQTVPHRPLPDRTPPSATFGDVLAAGLPHAASVRPSPPSAATAMPQTWPTDAPAPPLPATPARYGRNPAPPYPAEARRHGWEGTVILLVEIRENGRPERVEVKHSSGHPVLDEAARRAVRGWTFIPAQRDGKPIRSVAEVPIVFSLRPAP
jgi:protein TonB